MPYSSAGASYQSGPRRQGTQNITLSVGSHDGRSVAGGKEEVTSPVQVALLEWIQRMVHGKGSSTFIAEWQNREEG
jgi:hypothetical protein